MAPAAVGFHPAASRTATHAEAPVFYIDTSALLKLLWAEPESDVVGSYVAREDLVVMSILTEVEADNRLRAAWLAGRYGAPA